MLVPYICVFATSSNVLFKRFANTKTQTLKSDRVLLQKKVGLEFYSTAPFVGYSYCSDSLISNQSKFPIFKK